MKNIEEHENENMIMKRIFAAKAHENRKSRKITQERLSEMVGITDVYLRSIENGKNLPNWLIWLKLCTVLEIDIFELQQKYIRPFLGLENRADSDY